MDDPLSLAVEHGYPVLFAMLLLSGLGIPIPEDIPLVAAGVLAAHGGLGVWQASLACGGFVLTRDSIVFFLGRRYGRALLSSRWGRWVVSQTALDLAENQVRRHPNLVIFTGRFLPGLRSAVFFAAGSCRIHPGRFFVVDSLAGVISLPLFVWLGFAFASNIETVRMLLAEFRIGVLVTAGLLLGFALFRLRRHRLRGEASKGTES